MTIHDLFIPFILAAVAVIIWRHMTLTHRAVSLAAQHTEKQGVSLLDQSVILKKLRVVKSKYSLIAIERTFLFYFSSTGDRRYEGRIIFHGQRFSSIELQPFKITE